MRYLEFIENTKNMKPAERSKYFDDLTEEQQSDLMDDTFSRDEFSKEYMLLQVRIIHAAEIIESEQNEFKRSKYLEAYDNLCKQAEAIRNKI